MKIGIVGNGTVGHALARCYIENYDVRVWDNLDEKSTHSFMDTVRESDIVFVCIPEGSLDTFFNFKFGSANREAEIRQRNFVLKSTVPIGTTKRLREQHGLPNLVHSPEFLTERCAVTDAQLPARNIIGIPDRNVPNFCYGRLRVLYDERFPGIQIFDVTSDESEAIKLMTNAFFATKITFFNEIYDLCRMKELDWDTVLKGILSDGRISYSHTKVPGPDGERGFGGKCLPKDLEMLVNEIDEYELNSLLDKVQIKNLIHRENT